ncbi:MAG: hypothetical protein R3Y64_02710 [Peptostreptococcaceae bacterium]
MENKNNKIKIALAIVIIAVVAFFGIDKFVNGSKVEGAKVVYVNVIDESTDEIILENEKFETETTTLEAFLEENKEELNVELDSSQYGAFLVGINGIKTEEMSTGPWWMYGFISEDQGIDYQVGQAPGISEVNLGKENTVTFKFTTNTGH